MMAMIEETVALWGETHINDGYNKDTSHDLWLSCNIAVGRQQVEDHRTADNGR